ncbi:MAG: hypothetical protein WCC57_17970 [Paracoccaceae bacterium]
MKRAVVLCVLLLASPAMAQNEAPPLAEGDVLALRVPGQPDLSGQWPIGEGASLEVPGLGRVEGIRDLEHARVLVRGLIDERLGLGDVVFSLGVQSWRPVIVGGAVNAPGDVPFRPGLRLIEAVALAGGEGGLGGGGVLSTDFSRRVQINQEQERLMQTESRLARALARQARLFAELDGTEFKVLPTEVTSMIGDAQATLLFQREAEIGRIRAQTRSLAFSRLGAALEIGQEDIVAQEAINTSLGRQLDLVRDNLTKLQPLFDNGSLTGARILELRRDFVDIEGRVSEARARLAQARAGQAVLAEENDALDLQLRLEVIEELVGTQFEILDAESSLETISATLQAAGGTGSTRQTQPADCRAVIMRNDADGKPKVIEADPLSRVQPGDYLQIGRATRDCPEFLVLGSPAQ